MIDSSAARWVALSILPFVAVVMFPVHARSNAVDDLPFVRIAQADTANEPAGGRTARLDAVDTYRLSLLKLKGHLTVARTLLQLREPGATYHLREPVQRIFDDAAAELQRRSAPLSADTLEQLERATLARPEAALAIIDSAAAAIDGSFAQTGLMNGPSALALSEALLTEAVALYAGAVADNEVTDVRTYQSGRGLVVQAEALVRHASGLRDSPRQDALVAAVVLIRQAWPGVNPPPIVFDPASVSARLEEAIAAMDRIR